MSARRIARYRLTFTGEQTVTVPARSKLLTVQRSEAERDEMDLWVETTPTTATVEYTVWLVKTDGPIPPEACWMGLVQLGGGALILHVYVTHPTAAGS